MHPLDDIFGHDDEPRYHYEWVGRGNGRYRERTPGSGVFDYVQPGNGDYERELLPPDHTCRYIGACLGVVLAAILLIATIHQLLKEPPFDCETQMKTWQQDWSWLKKAYCCETEEVGCSDSGQMQVVHPHGGESGGGIPLWLDRWLSDLNIGAKFFMTMSMALVLGCLGGAFCFYMTVRYCNPPRRAKTETQLVEEAKTLLQKQNKAPGDKIDVTLMWDTEEDLELVLVHPDPHGQQMEVTASKQDEAGGVPGKSKVFAPIRHIKWEDNHPGEYRIKVRCGQRELHMDANLTIIKSVHGVREILHHRMLPGLHEKLIATFLTGQDGQRHGSNAQYGLSGANSGMYGSGGGVGVGGGGGVSFAG